MANKPAERFLCAPGLRLESVEKLSEVQFEQVAQAMARLEVSMERLEKRLWVTVFGVVAAILASAVESLLNMGSL